MSNLLGRKLSAVLVSGFASIGIAQAASVSVSDPFVMLDNVSPNPEGVLEGNDIFFGATSVVPNGANGTTGVATVSSDPSFSRTIAFQGLADLPNFFGREVADTPNLQGIWSLAFSNPSLTTTTAQETLGATQQVAFVNSITVNGTGTSPTISWTAPQNTQVNGYRVNIYDTAILDANGHPTQIYTQSFLPTVTSFTVPSNGDLGASQIPIAAGTTYYLEVQVLQTRDDTSNNLGNNSDIAARSRTFVSFQILPPTASPTVYLPVVQTSGSFQFNMQVTPGQTYYIDPSVATGYVYKTNPGDPNFASVILLTLQSTPYDLSYLLNGTEITVLLAGGTPYTFLQSGGIDTFTVTGIDPNLMLDPTNPTAFITGLTFENVGMFTGTMTPITNSPLPAALPLFAIGLGGLGLFGWRRKRKSRVS